MKDQARPTQPVSKEAVRQVNMATALAARRGATPGGRPAYARGGELTRGGALLDEAKLPAFAKLASFIQFPMTREELACRFLDAIENRKSIHTYIS